MVPAGLGRIRTISAGFNPFAESDSGDSEFLVLLVPAQLASMILFDSTGLDVLVPDFVFMAVVPTLAVACPPTLAAWRLYSPRMTRATAAVAFAATALVAAHTTQFYGMAGRAADPDRASPVVPADAGVVRHPIERMSFTTRSNERRLLLARPDAPK